MTRQTPSLKHIRILGYGNNANYRNSIAEVSFLGEGLSMEGVRVSARSDEGNIPENTVDGDLQTRWSAHDMGQWIRYDFPDYLPGAD